MYRYISKLCKNNAELLVTGAAWLSKVITAGQQMVAVRIITNALGMNQYAAFALLMGLMNWFLLSDGCIGVSLQNFISEARAEGKNYDVYLKVVFVIGIILLLLVILILFVLSAYIGPKYLIHFNFISKSDKTKFFFVAGTLFTSFAIGSIIYKVWYSEQLGYLAHIWQALSALLGLLGVWLISPLVTTHKFLWIMIIFNTPATIIPLLAFFWKVKDNLSLNYLEDFSVAKKVLKRAVGFWLFALMITVVLQVDYIVISQLFKFNDVVIYAIITKIFSFVYFLYDAMLKAAWPNCTELYIRKEWKGIKTKIKALLKGGFFLIGIFTVSVFIFKQSIIKILTGSSLSLSTTLIGLFSVYYLIRIWTDTFGMVIQSMSDLKSISKWVPVQAGLSTILQWYFAKRFGLIGIVAGLTFSYLFTLAWVLPHQLFLKTKTV